MPSPSPNSCLIMPLLKGSIIPAWKTLNIMPSQASKCPGMVPCWVSLSKAGKNQHWRWSIIWRYVAWHPHWEILRLWCCIPILPAIWKYHKHNLIRLSVGIENITDLTNDLDSALSGWSRHSSFELDDLQVRDLSGPDIKSEKGADLVKPLVPACPGVKM